MTGGNSYLFVCGQTHNFEDMLQNSGSTSSPIVVGSYGTGTKPVITRYRELDSSECIEVSVAGGDATTTPASGTNIWRVPRQFFGLYGDRTWGVRSDPADEEGSAITDMPDAAKDWARADYVAGNHTSCIIFSVGNPVTNWGVLVSNWLDAENLNINNWFCIGFNEVLNGSTVSDLSFQDCYAGVLFFAGSTANLATVYARQVRGAVLERCDAFNVRSVAVFGGGNSLTKGHGFYRARIRYNHCENLGGSAFNQISTGISMNGLRIHDNVIHGACHSESSGGIYFSLFYCTDGGRAIIEYNTVSDVDYGNLFPTDGYGIYTEQQCADTEYRNNYVFDCEAAPMHANRPNGNIAFTHNVCLARVGGDTTAAFTPVYDIEAAHVTMRNNVVLDFDRFAGASFGDVGMFISRANVSLLVTDHGGITSPIRTGAGYITGKIVSDNDNFYGHGSKWIDANGVDKTADATNRNTSNPTTETARIPLPAMGTESGRRTNLARLVSPNWWSSTVSLRMGTRLVV